MVLHEAVMVLIGRTWRFILVMVPVSPMKDQVLCSCREMSESTCLNSGPRIRVYIISCIANYKKVTCLIQEGSFICTVRF